MRIVAAYPPGGPGRWDDMYASGYPGVATQLRRQEAKPPSAGVAVFFVGAVLLAPWIAIAGIVLLASGLLGAGCACLLAAIASRALASASVRLRERRPRVARVPQ